MDLDQWILAVNELHSWVSKTYSTWLKQENLIGFKTKAGMGIISRADQCLCNPVRSKQGMGCGSASIHPVYMIL